jgi:hypothetical protein
MFPYFQALESSYFGNMVRESTWMFAVIESVHLLALAVIGGAVLLVDFRIFGFGLTGRPVRELGSEMQKYLSVSLVVLIISGLGLFLSEAVKCYYSTPFWVKMTSLLLAIIFTYTVHRTTVARTNLEVSGATRAIALVSVVLWFTVAASGRWIGFSG